LPIKCHITIYYRYPKGFLQWELQQKSPEGRGRPSSGKLHPLKTLKTGAKAIREVLLSLFLLTESREHITENVHLKSQI
jgi:hypothetical protein